MSNYEAAIFDFNARLKIHGETKRQQCITDAAIAYKINRSDLVRAINLELAIAYFKENKGKRSRDQIRFFICDVAERFGLGVTFFTTSMNRRSIRVQNKNRKLLSAAKVQAAKPAPVAEVPQVKMKKKERPPSPYEQLQLKL